MTPSQMIIGIESPYPCNGTEAARAANWLIDYVIPGIMSRTDLGEVSSVTCFVSSIDSLTAGPVVPITKADLGDRMRCSGVVVIYPNLPADMTFFTAAVLKADVVVRRMEDRVLDDMDREVTAFAVWARSSVRAVGRTSTGEAVELDVEAAKDVVPGFFLRTIN